MPPYYKQSAQKVLEGLGSSREGLSEREAESRLGKFGLNKISRKDRVHVVGILLHQVFSPLPLILIAAGALSLLVGGTGDAVVILAVVAINTGIGFFEEYKAESIIKSLKEYQKLQARVIRGGEERIIEAWQVVPGDILKISSGERVAADGRILETYHLEMDESLLTGESRRVRKVIASLSGDDLGIFGQQNSVFAGTDAVEGAATIVVTRTGQETEMGRIAKKLEEKSPTPTNLERQIKKLGAVLAFAALGIVLGVLVLGTFRGKPPEDILLLGVSLAVSLVPEGLTVLVTVTLALGVRRLARRNALIRHLPAVEALSSVDVYCVDKTGTLTENRMTVERTVSFSELLGKMTQKEELEKIKEISVLCSSSLLESPDETEVALLKFYGLANQEIGGWRRHCPRLDLISFSPERDYMASLNRIGGKNFILVKGSPEAVLARSRNIKGRLKALQAKIRELSSSGFRILAFASKNFEGRKFSEEDVWDLDFLGLALLAGTPRPGVKEALSEMRQAGVRVIMLTGDLEGTALRVARDVGWGRLVKTLSGAEVRKMSKSQLEEAVEEIDIYWRVNPQEKLKILEALLENGREVAMTGDGTNDALVLKRANLGIAVAEATEIAKDAADMVLLDSSFTTIPKALFEARRIITNIKKFLILTLSSNLDEVAVVLSSLVFGFPLPYLPIHILWLNLVTDGLPALALAIDRGSKDLLTKKPQEFRRIFGGILPFILVAGGFDFLTDLLAFFVSKDVWGFALPTARAITLLTTTLFEFVLVFSVRRRTFNLKQLFDNKALLLAVGVTLFAQVFAFYTSIGNQVLKLAPVPLVGLLLAVVVNLVGFGLLEVYKRFSGFRV